LHFAETPHFFYHDRREAFGRRKGLNAMEIVAEQVTSDELVCMAERTFGNMVKAVVDVDRELLAVDGELHSDLEALLIENGSRQQSLWGINLYPAMTGDDFVEFDSMINMRPSQGNTSRGVESAETRGKILYVVAKRIRR
jgi:Protein of unknown function (DUF5674)